MNEAGEQWLLVVDDEPDMRWILSRVFERAGWHVVTAETGAEAISHLDKRKFTAILIDWRLPDMDGTQLTRRIRELGTSAAIVLMSGLDPKTTSIREAYSEGLIECFLPKPFIHDQIVQSVELAVARRKASG